MCCVCHYNENIEITDAMHVTCVTDLLLIWGELFVKRPSRPEGPARALLACFKRFIQKPVVPLSAPS